MSLFDGTHVCNLLHSGDAPLLCLLHLPTCAVPEELEANKEEEGKEMWQADWDDEDSSEDFQAKLKQELDRDMKD